MGEAFTLRYMPAREDLNKLDVFRDRAHPQRKAWCGGDQDGTPDGPKLHSIIVDPRDSAHLYFAMSGGGVSACDGSWLHLRRLLGRSRGWESGSSLPRSSISRLLERIRDELADVAVVEHMPKLEGRQMIMVLAPKRK